MIWNMIWRWPVESICNLIKRTCKHICKCVIEIYRNRHYANSHYFCFTWIRVYKEFILKQKGIVIPPRILQIYRYLFSSHFNSLIHVQFRYFIDFCYSTSLNISVHTCISPFTNHLLNGRFYIILEESVSYRASRQHMFCHVKESVRYSQG